MTDPSPLVPSGAAPLGDPMESHPLPPGTREFGPYEILSRLGDGGMGVVYRARQKDLNRIVALKVLLSGEHASRAHLDRFLDEAKATAKLTHPNITPLYDFGVHNGIHYFTMPFLTGRTLEAALSRNPRTYLDQPREAVRLILPVLDALEHAHASGVIHRDLKPANLMIETDGTPRLMDFGLARDVDSDRRLTKTGIVVGTPSYMSPEQALGRTGEVDARSDVYGIGAILYEMMTGRCPFEGSTPMETLEQVVGDDPVRPRRLNPALPRDLETVLLKALEKKPDRRYAGARAFADDLERWLQDRPVLARPAGLLERGLKLGRRHRRRVLLLAAVLAAVLVTAAAFLLEMNRRSRSESAVAQERERAYQDAIASADRAFGESRFREAETAYARALEIRPKDRGAEIGGRNARAAAEKLKESAMREADAALRKGEWALAEAALTKAAEIDPEDTGFRRRLDRARNHRVDVRWSGWPEGTILDIFPIDGETLAVGPESRRLELAAGTTNGIERGLHLLRASAPDRLTVNLPLDLRFAALPEASLDVKLALPETAAVPPGMCLISEGPCRIGGDAYQAGPTRRIDLAGFLIDRDEVTVREYARFVEAIHRAPPPAWKGPVPPPEILDHPVTDVSGEEAAAYAVWSGKRLPTEEEFEKAARGIDGRAYPWGNVADPSRANVESGGTEPVGARSGDVSPYGVRGLTGNVSEWTSSVWSLEGKVEPAFRVVRGNNWSRKHEYLSLQLDHAAARNRADPTLRDPGLGFRCAKDWK